MRRFCLAACLAVLPNVGAAWAQNISQTIFFGDSNTDSGRYRYLTPSAGMAPPGAGAYTTNPGLEWSQVLAARFGLSANPFVTGLSNGTDYASGGSRVIAPNGVAWSATTQVNTYLASTGGVADPNALYTIWIGTNDLKTSSSPNIINPLNSTNIAAVTTLANQTASLAIALRDAGARFIVIGNTRTDFPVNQTFYASPTGKNQLAARALYDTTVWTTAANAGVNVIPADMNALHNYVLANPSTFGITNTNVNTPACGAVLSYKCLPSNLVTPNADKTYFYADTDGHVSTAVQQIIGDYVYSLISAPSQISFLAENAVKSRTRFNNTVFGQIGLTPSERGPAGANSWVVGEVSHLGMNNYAGLPNDPSTPVALTAGIDYRFAPGVVVGTAVSASQLTSNFSWGGGNFKQDEVAVGAYASLSHGPIWANILAAYGRLQYDVHRDVTLGIAQFYNTGNSSGHDVSAAAEAGYKFRSGAFEHGPYVGLALQQVSIGGFAETGGVTSLAFGGQGRSAAISTLGYRANFTIGNFSPFAQVAWNREWANTDRTVTASLLSVAAPSYYMSAVNLGKDWGSAAIGTSIRLGGGLTANGMLTSDFSQRDVQAYGGRVGLAVSF